MLLFSWSGAASSPVGANFSLECRGVAQPGSAHAWGACGRRFKSGRPDQTKPQQNKPLLAIFNLVAPLSNQPTVGDFVGTLRQNRQFLASPRLLSLPAEPEPECEHNGRASGG